MEYKNENAHHIHGTMASLGVLMATTDLSASLLELVVDIVVESSSDPHNNSLCKDKEGLLITCQQYCS